MTDDRLPTPLLIARKRDGGQLDAREIHQLVEDHLQGDVDDAQMAALLMAGVIRGFSEDEAIALTSALLASGERIDLSRQLAPTVDKHSTGGVGDTTTFIVGPLLAAAGCQVVKLSGRGLGHTGGTIDKFAAIPGVRTDLSVAELEHQAEDVGIVIAAASASLVPADARLYALRDITATVPSAALIASSIMSKKIAGGAAAIMLDVKVGDGSFSPTIEDAVALADLCVTIGRAHDRATAALVTDMSQPLGDAIGNALEVRAAIEVLQGGGSSRLREVSLSLAAATLELLGHAPADALALVTRLLDDGSALERFRRLIVAQGGDGDVIENPSAHLPQATVVRAWSPSAGTVGHIACRSLGEIAGRLGAGRERAGGNIDPAVGLEVLVRIGDPVDGRGEGPHGPAVRIHARDEASAASAALALDSAIRTGESVVATPPLVQCRIGLPGEAPA